MSDMTMKHPAKFSAPILHEIVEVLINYGFGACADTTTILDPFAGSGKIHALREAGFKTWGVEIEEEWARMSTWTVCGDSTELTRILPSKLGKVDLVITSPAYGNRMADSYDGRDGSRRSTYRIALGRPLTTNNGAGMHFGDTYKQLHRQVWLQCKRMLRPDGQLLLNVSNYMKLGEEIDVVGWHTRTLTIMGFKLLEDIPIATARMRMASDASREQRVAKEHLLVFRRP